MNDWRGWTLTINATPQSTRALLRHGGRPGVFAEVLREPAGVRISTPTGAGFSMTQDEAAALMWMLHALGVRLPWEHDDAIQAPNTGVWTTEKERP